MSACAGPGLILFQEQIALFVSDTAAVGASQTPQSYAESERPRHRGRVGASQIPRQSRSVPDTAAESGRHAASKPLRTSPHFHSPGADQYSRDNKYRIRISSLSFYITIRARDSTAALPEGGKWEEVGVQWEDNLESERTDGRDWNVAGRKDIECWNFENFQE